MLHEIITHLRDRSFLKGTKCQKSFHLHLFAFWTCRKTLFGFGDYQTSNRETFWHLEQSQTYYWVVTLANTFRRFRKQATITIVYKMYNCQLPILSSHFPTQFTPRKVWKLLHRKQKQSGTFVFTSSCTHNTLVTLWLSCRKDILTPEVTKTTFDILSLKQQKILDFSPMLVKCSLKGPFAENRDQIPPATSILPMYLKPI